MKTKIAVAITIFVVLAVPITLAQVQVIGGKSVSVPTEIWKAKAIESKSDFKEFKLLASSINLGNGKQGIVVTGNDIIHSCGAMNCSIWIYQKIGKGRYSLLIDTIGTVVRLATGTTRGYRNLLIEGNGYNGTFIHTYKWNGKQYTETK
jgi:hypothetical protein